MNAPDMVGRPKARFVYCFIILFVLLLFGIFGLLHRLIGLTVFQNMTTSAPRGLYIGSRLGIDDLHVSDYVVIAMPYKVGKFEKGHNLLKQVKGFPGDEFVVSDKELVLHGHSYPIDRSYTMVPQLEPGHYIVPADTYLFLNPVADSFDCRYMGPVSKDEIRAKVVPALNYELLNARYKRVKAWWDHEENKEKENVKF